jgi:hypothetical protein
MIVSRRIAGCLTLIVLIGSAGKLHASPPDPPDLVYVDGVPCNSLCQAYMAWSRKTLAAGSALRPLAGVTRQAAEVSPAGSRPATRGRIARRTGRPAREIHRVTSISSARAAAAPRPMRPETSKAKAEPGSLSTRQAETPHDRQTEPSNTSHANAPSSSRAETPGAKHADMSDARITEAPSASQAEMSNAPDAKPSGTEFAGTPSAGQADPSSVGRAQAPPSLPETDTIIASGTKTAREQMMAAATMAEEMTGTTNAAAKPNAVESDKSKSSEDTNGGMTASISPGAADALVALLVSRPEITSMSDLTGKNVAIDDSRSESENNVRTALVAAGAPAVELSTGENRAIDRLIGGEVPAAVVALVSPDAADSFPDIAGFKVFRIPLSPLSIKTGTDKP